MPEEIGLHDVLKVIQEDECQVRSPHSKHYLLNLRQNLVNLTGVKDINLKKFLPEHTRNDNNELFWVFGINLELLGASDDHVRLILVDVINVLLKHIYAHFVIFLIV